MSNLTPAPRLLASAGSKVRLRLVLPCALLFLLSSIDRANVSFGALEMNKALGLTAAQYGLGAGIFFVGYLVAQVPSVLLLEKIGVRRWILTIMLLWGVAATSLAAIHSRDAFYTLRVILGIAEAGLAPGMMLYLSRWSGDQGRASIIAIPLMAIPMSLVVGGPLSGALLQMHNPLAIDGWRWMFLVEGLPAILLAFVAAWYLPDKPADARWLDAAERDCIADAASDRSTDGPAGRGWAVVRNPLLWLCTALWFCLLAGNYGVIFWLPQVVRGLSGLSPLEIGVVVALPWLANVAGIYLTSRHSDRAEERYLHMAIPSFVSAAAMVGAFLAGATILGLILLVILGAGLGCALAPYWAIPFRLLKPSERAIGISVVNVLASASGLIVPIVFGKLNEATGSFAVPAFALASLVTVGGILALVARVADPLKAAGGAARE